MYNQLHIHALYNKNRSACVQLFLGYEKGISQHASYFHPRMLCPHPNPIPQAEHREMIITCYTPTAPPTPTPEVKYVTINGHFVGDHESKSFGLCPISINFSAHQLSFRTCQSISRSASPWPPCIDQPPCIDHDYHHCPTPLRNGILLLLLR